MPHLQKRRSSHAKTTPTFWQKQSVCERVKDKRVRGHWSLSVSGSPPNMAMLLQLTSFSVTHTQVQESSHKARLMPTHNTFVYIFRLETCIFSSAHKPITRFYSLPEANLPQTRSFHTRVVSQVWLPETVCVTGDCTSVCVCVAEGSSRSGCLCFSYGVVSEEGSEEESFLCCCSTQALIWVPGTNGLENSTIWGSGMPPPSSPTLDSSHGNSYESLLWESSSKLCLCNVVVGKKVSLHIWMVEYHIWMFKCMVIETGCGHKSLLIKAISS